MRAFRNAVAGIIFALLIGSAGQARAMTAKAQPGMFPGRQVPTSISLGYRGRPAGSFSSHATGKTGFNRAWPPFVAIRVEVQPSIPAVTSHRALAPAARDSAMAVAPQDRTIVAALDGGVELVRRAVATGDLHDATNAIFAEGSRRSSLMASAGFVLPPDPGADGSRDGLGGTGSGGSGGNRGDGGESGGRRYPDPKAHFSTAREAARAIGPDASLIGARFTFGNKNAWGYQFYSATVNKLIEVELTSQGAVLKTQPATKPEDYPIGHIDLDRLIPLSEAISTIKVKQHRDLKAVEIFRKASPGDLGTVEPGVWYGFHFKGRGSPDIVREVNAERTAAPTSTQGGAQPSEPRHPPPLVLTVQSLTTDKIVNMTVTGGNTVRISVGIGAGISARGGVIGLKIGGYRFAVTTQLGQDTRAKLRELKALIEAGGLSVAETSRPGIDTIELTWVIGLGATQTSQASSPEQVAVGIADEYIQAHRDAFALSEQDVPSLQEVRLNRLSSRSSIARVRYSPQRHHDVVVERTELEIVILLDERRVVNSGGAWIRNIDVPTTPGLDAEQARQSLAGKSIEWSAWGGQPKSYQISPSDVGGSAQLVIIPLGQRNNPRLAWKIRVGQKGPLCWDVYVDATVANEGILDTAPLFRT